MCRQEQISESVDNVFCLKSDDIVDSTSSASNQREHHHHQQQEETLASTAATATDYDDGASSSELLEESGSMDPPPVPHELVDALEEDIDKVDFSVAEELCTQVAPTEEDMTTETVPAADAEEGDDSQQPAATLAASQNILQDSLSGAKRILRMPYDSIRRRGDLESSAAGSDDSTGGEVAPVESPGGGGGGGLMSRTLGSITALPSLFAKSSDSSSTPPPPLSPRSTPAADKNDRSPGSGCSAKTPRMFFFQRFVGRSATNSSEPDTPESSRTADDGKI